MVTGEVKMTEVLFKVIIIGDPAVGKTSFVQRYVNDSFKREYKGTIGVDFALKIIRWADDQTIKIQLWDIAGQERFTSMTRVYYKDAHACLIMFDLSKKSSFVNALRWKKDLDEKCSLADGSMVPCLLLGNKCDLGVYDVAQKEIESTCRDHMFLGWTEVSVKESIMIEEAMRFLLEEVVSKHNELSEMKNNLTYSGNQQAIQLNKEASFQENGNACKC